MQKSITLMVVMVTSAVQANKHEQFKAHLDAQQYNEALPTKLPHINEGDMRPILKIFIIETAIETMPEGKQKQALREEITRLKSFVTHNTCDLLDIYRACVKSNEKKSRESLLTRIEELTADLRAAEKAKADLQTILEGFVIIERGEIGNGGEEAVV
jgi:hypothetical protein